MRFASLGSGSRGNATLVESGDTCVLIDCGFSVAEMERRLTRLEREPTDISAVLVTHEHADHISGVARLARRYGMPVWMTAGTRAAHKGGEIPDLRVFSTHQNFRIGTLEVQPFPVPHDAREPSQFVFHDGRWRLGVLTDTGSITEHIVRSLDGCDALLLECNHDTQMLAVGPYPPSLKARVGGRLGHLNNQQAAGLLDAIDTGRLQQLVVAHISEKNNRPALALDALCGVLGWSEEAVTVACQDTGFGWCEPS